MGKLRRVESWRGREGLRWEAATLKLVPVEMKVESEM